MSPKGEHSSRIPEYLATLCGAIMPSEAVSELLNAVLLLPEVGWDSSGGVVWPSYVSIRIMRALLMSSMPVTDFASTAEIAEIRKLRVQLYFRLLHQVNSAVMSELEADADHSARMGDWPQYMRHRFVWRARARLYLLALYWHGLQFRCGRSVDIRSVAAELTELLAALEQPQ